MKRFSMASYYSEIRNGTSTSRDFTIFGSKSTHFGQFEFRDQLRIGQTNTYGADVVINPPFRDGQILLGMDKLGSPNGRTALTPKISLRLPFFGGHLLHLTYTSESGTNLFQFRLTGPIIRRR